LPGVAGTFPGTMPPFFVPCSDLKGDTQTGDDQSGKPGTIMAVMRSGLRMR
jgi:hypothetical protein